MNICVLAFVVSEILAPRFRASVSYDEIRSDRSRSFEIQSQLAAQYFRQNTLEYSFKRDSRLFDSGFEGTDYIHRLSHISPLHSYLYLEAAVSLSPSPTFSPQRKYELDPHLTAFNQSDFGLGLNLSQYRNENVLNLKPSWRFEYSETWVFNLKTEVSLHPENTFNVQESVIFSPSTRWEHRLYAGQGKSYEGDQLTPSFYTLSFSSKRTLNAVWSLLGSMSYYDSDLRAEWRFGAQLESRF